MVNEHLFQTARKAKKEIQFTHDAIHPSPSLPSLSVPTIPPPLSILFKKQKRAFFCCFISGIKRCLAPYFNTTTPDPTQHVITTQFLAKNNVPMLAWPSMFPDLNPDKNTWNELGRCVRGRGNAPTNVRELFQRLKKEWLAIPAQVIHNLIQSMPMRCWAVTDSREGHTPY